MPTSCAGRQSSDGRGRIRPLTHRGKASRRGAAAAEVPPANHSDRRADPGAGDLVQASTEDQEEREVVPVLEHDQLVGGKVVKVDVPPGRDDPGMFPHTEPSNVREQETSLNTQYRD